MATHASGTSSQASQLNRSCAWLLLVLSVVGLPGCAVIWALLAQGADLALPLHNLVAQGLLPADSPLFAVAAWAPTAALWALVSCLPCAAIATGMLRRQHWARRGFVALMLATAVLNLTAVLLADWLIAQLMGPMLETFRLLSDPAAFHPELWHVRAVVALFNLPMTLVLAGLHAWLAWRFARPDMRALYQQQAPSTGHRRSIG